MRYVDLFRHTDNDGDSLSPQGMAAAESIGRQRLSPPYSLFASTGAHRATQMAEILRREVHQEDTPVVELPALRSAVEERWRDAAKAAGKGETLDEIRAVDPDLVDKESALLGGGLRAVFDALPDEGRALVVGHSPTNEAAVLGLTGNVVDPLGKGDGVQVVEDQGSFRVQPMPSAHTS